jgi:hypothetical protein
MKGFAVKSIIGVGVVYAMTTLPVQAAPAWFTSSVGDPTPMNTYASSVNNPAASADLFMDGEDTYSLGLLSMIGGRVEYGPVDNMIDKMDDLANRLDSTNIDTTSADAIKNEFDDILVQAGEDGYFNFSTSLNFPLVPLVISKQAINGAITVDANVSLLGKLKVLDAPLVFNDIANTIETDTALYIKGAVQSELNLGYSRPIMEIAGGQLYAGGRVKLVQMGLTKSVLSLSETDDIAESAADRSSENLETTANVALDGGLLWKADYFTVGATFYNINEPSFDYPTIGTGCLSMPIGEDRENCVTAQNNVHRISLEETHIMNAHTKVDIAVHTENDGDGMIALSAAYDVSPIIDPLGDEFQYMTTTLSYISDGIIPGISIGFRKNMVGTELSDINFGMNLFGHAYFNLTIGQETIEIEDSEVPRLIAGNIGIDFTF